MSLHKNSCNFRKRELTPFLTVEKIYIYISIYIYIYDLHKSFYFPFHMLSSHSFVTCHLLSHLQCLVFSSLASLISTMLSASISQYPNIKRRVFFLIIFLLTVLHFFGTTVKLRCIFFHQNCFSSSFPICNLSMLCFYL